jgi:hypothetical protein
VTVRHGLDDVAAEPLAEFHHALLVAVKMTTEN